MMVQPRGSASPSERLARSDIGSLVVFGLWLALFALLAWTHTPWRDEVRALSIVMEAGSLSELFAGIRPEGHPLLWYALLKLGYAVSGSPLALPAVAALVAIASAALIVFRAPFSLPLRAAIVFSQVVLIHFGVIARNYGIAFLLILCFAALMREPRRNAPWIALVLFLLPNANVPGAALVPVLGLVWAGALLPDRARLADWLTLAKSPVVLAVAAAALAGIALCAITVYPPTQDLFTIRHESIAWSLAKGIANPGELFTVIVNDLLPGWTTSILMVLMIAGLRREPLLAMALGVVTLILVALFAAVYPGWYRHQSMLIAAAVALYWIAGDRHPGQGIHRMAGEWPLLTTMAAVVVTGGPTVKTMIDAPFTMAPRLCETLSSRPDLKDAILLAEPQWLLESVPYYCPNRLYLTREERFGTVSIFASSNMKVDYALRDLLDTADRLHKETGHPIVLVVSAKLDLEDPRGVENYREKVPNMTPVTFAFDKESLAELARRTTRLEAAVPTLTDETYDILKFE